MLHRVEISRKEGIGDAGHSIKIDGVEIGADCISCDISMRPGSNKIILELLVDEIIIDGVFHSVEINNKKMENTDESEKINNRAEILDL